MVRCKADGICPTMDDISYATNLDIRDTERIVYAMLDLGHVVRFRDRRERTRFRLFSPEGPPRRSAPREQPSNNRTPSPKDDSD